MQFKGKSFLKLNKNGVKGENGCIAVIGGSKIYTGAPIFASLGALRSGSELVYVFTVDEAISSIKKINELIVLPLELNTRILDKITCCIVGPGLGRPEESDMLSIINILNYLDSRDIPFVLDADAIHHYKTGCISHLKRVVLTPNFKEAKNLKILEGHGCIYKGKTDIIKVGSVEIKVDTPSSYKRCGGQGDILSGILATSLSINKDDLSDACLSACELLRRSTFLACEKHGFSLITSDIFNEIKYSLFEFIENNQN